MLFFWMLNQLFVLWKMLRKVSIFCCLVLLMKILLLVVSVVEVQDVVLLWLKMDWWLQLWSFLMFLIMMMWLGLQEMIVFIFCSMVIRFMILGLIVVLCSFVMFLVWMVVSSICLVVFMFGYGRWMFVLCRWLLLVDRWMLFGSFLMIVLNLCSVLRWKLIGWLLMWQLLRLGMNVCFRWCSSGLQNRIGMCEVFVWVLIFLKCVDFMLFGLNMRELGLLFFEM